MALRTEKKNRVRSDLERVFLQFVEYFVHEPRLSPLERLWRKRSIRTLLPRRRWPKPCEHGASPFVVQRRLGAAEFRQSLQLESSSSKLVRCTCDHPSTPEQSSARCRRPTQPPVRCQTVSGDPASKVLGEDSADPECGSALLAAASPDW